MQAIGHHGASGAAASRPNGNPGRFGKAYKIPHDEEIVRKAHFLNHVDLIFQLLHVFRMRRAVQFIKAFPAKLLKIGKTRYPLRKLEFRQEVLTECEFHIASLCNLDGIFKRFRHIREEAAQFFFTLEIEFFRLKFHTVRVVYRLASLDAEQHILHFCV